MKALRPILLLFVLPAFVVALLPAAHDGLLYDHEAILRGELWRLWTGHWVHFSASHLGWNLLVLGMAGAWLEHSQPGQLLRYTWIAAPLISLGFIVFAPTMQTYGGLSGLATGVVTLLALTAAKQSPRDRRCWQAVLALVTVKILLDASRAHPLFSDFADAPIRLSALAHALGAGTAAFFFVLPVRRAGIVPVRPELLPRSPLNEPHKNRRAKNYDHASSPGSGAFRAGPSRDGAGRRLIFP